MINSALAQCKKIYIQGQNTGSTTDHFPASNNFNLPLYADTARTIIVAVDGVRKLRGNQWDLVASAPNYVQFLGLGLQVYDTQKVEITYFVNLAINDVMKSKQEALSRIDTICQCGGSNKCNLAPQYVDNNGTQELIDYSCVFPPPNIPDPPLQQIVRVSAKSVPYRYFDTGGAPQDDVTLTTTTQEGNLFEYTNNDLLTPNNVAQYIGFTEIYGSLGTLANKARAPKVINVKNNKSYDIFVDRGSFSQCLTCGSDYYSTLARLFPETFDDNGGGYTPDLTQTDPFTTSTYRKDDLHFGRACYVPVTMIPYSHFTFSDRQQQRLRRLKAQHFYAANGYQRDWYGFDYGSLIGSFDGTTWFAIGNARRIKSTSNKLFLAINAYFGDLTADNEYNVTILESDSNLGAVNVPTKDIETTGAECQQQHLCDSDQECVARLGYDYTCQPIGNQTTLWPVFDENATEFPDVASTERLTTLFKTGSTSSKRCVYRGRGSACHIDYTVDSASSFSGTDIDGMHACSMNNYCQRFVVGGPQARFNNKIARFARSVRTQNSSTTIPETDLDIFGLGSRIMGRPYLYNGDQTIDSEVQAQLNANKVVSMCIPGRNPNNTTLANQHSQIPLADFGGDQVSGIGMTSDSLSATVSSYYSSCSVLDDSGNFFHNTVDPTTVTLSTNTAAIPLVGKAASQNMSTNAYRLLESALGSLSFATLLKDFDTEFVDSPTYQPNRCIRAPGASCHSDYECGPNRQVASVLNSLSPDDATMTAIVNNYEIRFWKESLVCSQAQDASSADFDPSNNRCCRASGNEITIGTDQAQLDSFNTSLVPGTGIALDQHDRYSRMHTVADLLNLDGAGLPVVNNTANTEHPHLIAPSANECAGALANCNLGQGSGEEFPTLQFNTINKIGTRTCCGQNWIRNFSDENGGGHVWSPGKMQNIPLDTFKCLNWLPCTDTGDPLTTECGTNFTCDHVTEPNEARCLMRSITLSQATEYFNFIDRLELTGIPQIPVQTIQDNGAQCIVNPIDQSVNANTLLGAPDGNVVALPNTIQGTLPVDLNTVEFSLNISGTDTPFFNTMDSTGNFQTNIKQVFSEDSFSCCIPAGETVDASVPADRCCSGFIANGKCALPDYTDLSVYYNRYVSSAADGANPNLFDETTGYAKSPSTIEALAITQGVCASGQIFRGIALSPLKVPGHESKDFTRQRFLDGRDEANNQNGLADLYLAGLKWNTHVYCVPQGFSLGN